MSELLPEALRQTLPPIGAQDGAEPGEVMIHLRYRAPAIQWEWYVMEGEETGDPEEGNEDVMLFGFVKGAAQEYGTFMLSDLTYLNVVRDEAFEPGLLPMIAARYGLDVALGEAP